jgi:hypothetical protein
LRTDWIDYWAVDYDFKSKKELVRVKKEDGKRKNSGTWDNTCLFVFFFFSKA